MAIEEADKIILGVDPGTNVMGYGILKVHRGKAKMIVMGIIDMRKEKDSYIRLGKILQRITAIINEYKPTELAIEAPFFGKNIQSMLKLGRAQGVAIAAAIQQNIPIYEYAPLKIKMAITGSGVASKEQVAGMLQKILNIAQDNMPAFMDATDALGAAYCHFLQSNIPITNTKKYNNWKDFALKNQNRVKKQ